MSKRGSSVEKVNDFFLTAFRAITHKNVFVTHCCCLSAIKINSERERFKGGPRTETERKSGCDVSSLPSKQLGDKNHTVQTHLHLFLSELHVNPGIVCSV